MWWLVWFWVAAPRPPVAPAFSPPDHSILLQRSGQVRLTWNRPGRRFTVRVWQGETLCSQVTTTERELPLSVEPGGQYRWTLQSSSGGAVESHVFSVAEKLEYHADGRSGVVLADGNGQPGTNGDHVKVELVRDAHGMNLYIFEPRQVRRYLFCEPGLRFSITARGGNGGKGRDGISYSRHPWGWSGGAAGWGGQIRVVTRTAPWRDYLDLDVTAGKAGAGGAGGVYIDGDETVEAPDGPPGRLGQGGKVETQIAEP